MTWPCGHLTSPGGLILKKKQVFCCEFSTLTFKLNENNVFMAFLGNFTRDFNHQIVSSEH